MENDWFTQHYGQTSFPMPDAQVQGRPISVAEACCGGRGPCNTQLGTGGYPLLLRIENAAQFMALCRGQA